MAKFQPLKEFSFEPVEWPAWKERYERYCRASKLDAEGDSVRIDALVYTMGEKADKILKTFAYSTSEDKTKYDTILAKFSEYFVPRRNIINERCIFHSRKQAEHECIEQYYSDLYELILNCDYPDTIRDDLLRDRFVLGLCDGDMQRKLYMEHDLDIKKAVDMARQNELIKLQMKAQTPGVAVHEVTKSRGGQPPRGRGRGVDGRSRGGERGGFRGRGDNRQVQHDARNVHRDGSCDNCGYPRHKEGEKCPAWGKTCSLCSKRNHFRRKCRSKTVHEAVVYPEVACALRVCSPPAAIAVIQASSQTLICKALRIDSPSHAQMNKQRHKTWSFCLKYYILSKSNKIQRQVGGIFHLWQFLLEKIAHGRWPGIKKWRHVNKWKPWSFQLHCTVKPYFSVTKWKMHLLNAW